MGRSERDFEEEAASIALRLGAIFAELDDVELIAAAVVEALAPIAHQRRESIASSFIDPKRKMRAVVSADCACVDCMKVALLSAAAETDLL